MRAAPNYFFFFNFVSSILLVSVCVSQSGLIAAQPGISCSNCSDTIGNYTSSSTYSRNLLKSLLSEITTSTAQIRNGFYKLSVGQDPDSVYGTAVCRADLSVSDCQSCLHDVAHLLPQMCPVQKEATGYYSGRCMIRYSDRDILRDVVGQNSPPCLVPQNPLSIQGPELISFNHSLGVLLDRLKHSVSAAAGKFSRGVEQVTHDLQIYYVAQCNPDLSTVECWNCLQQVSNSLLKCCTNMTGAGLDGPFCFLHFGNYPILVTSNSGSLQNAAASNSSSAGSTGGIKLGRRNGAYKIWIIIIVLVIVVFLIAVTVLGLSRRKMRKQAKGTSSFKLADSLELDFRILQSATENFSDNNHLGGNYSCATSISMYKGVLPDGQEIVVKKLINKGGRERKKEFDNVVLLSANFQHKNLVKFLGFCVQKDARLLVDEFLPNGGLHNFLCDPIKRASLDWPTRYHIISGVARGLLYLHEDSQVRVIHRDIKPDNILLDAQMVPKISNFRTASLVRANQSKIDTGVVGTYGYMPVEYVQHGHSSIKSDIFSFGIVLLEIISGYIISEFSGGGKEENLLTYAWMKWCDGTVLDVVDQTLSHIDRHANQIIRCIKIGLLCVEEEPRHRPSMSTVVFMLNSDTVDISEPIRPTALILDDTGLHSNCHTTETYDSHQTSLNEASITTLDPR